MQTWNSATEHLLLLLIQSSIVSGFQVLHGTFVYPSEGSKAFSEDSAPSGHVIALAHCSSTGNGCHKGEASLAALHRHRSSPMECISSAGTSHAWVFTKHISQDLPWPGRHVPLSMRMERDFDLRSPHRTSLKSAFVCLPDSKAMYSEHATITSSTLQSHLPRRSLGPFSRTVPDLEER